MKKVRLAALAALTGFAALGSATQAQFVWDAGASPDNTWTNPLNWTADSAFPTAADSAQWTVGGGTPTPSTVDLSAVAEASDLQVIDREVTFNLNSFSLNVGANQSNFDGNDGHAIFDGNGMAGSSVTFGGTIRLGADAPEPGTLATGSRLTARGGVKVSSNGLGISRFRGAGILTVDGAGTEWNSSGAVTLNVSGYASGGSIYQQPRSQLLITNGGVFNHDTGNSSAALFSISRNEINPQAHEAKIVVDGAGSQLNILGNYASNFMVGGYGAATNWEFTNGGVLNSPLNLGMSFRHEPDTTKGPNTNTYTISGANSKMSALAWGVALRSSDSAVPRGNTVVNVLTGGTFEATGKDGSDRSITVGNRGRLALGGGTVAIPSDGEVVLRDTGVPTTPAILEGFGTITGGTLRVRDNSIVRPGGTGAAGTLTIQNGNLIAETTGVGSAQLEFDLSTSSSAHDRIALLATGSSATIPGSFTYNNIGSGTGGSGNQDFLLADTISYSGLGAGDITSGIDNLESIMTTAGFTRVFTDPAAANEYRYFIVPDVSGTLDALRLQLFAVVAASTWNKDDSISNWTDAGSWVGGVPNGAGATASFGSVITANQQVNVNAAVTVGTMNFDDNNSYTLAGSGITMDVSSGSAAINVTNGAHLITSNVSLADDTTATVASGGSIKLTNLQAASVNISKAGAGALEVNNVRTTGTLDVAAGSVVVTAQGDPTNASSAAGVSKVNSLALGAGGKIDITNNKLITQDALGSWNGTAYTGVTGLVQEGRGDGTWNGARGIVTSQSDATTGVLTTLAVASGAEIRGLGPTDTDVFAGQTINGDSTVVMYTWGGDADLNGELNGDDYFFIDSNVINSGSVFGFHNGDFDLNGEINGDDYFIIDSNITFAQGSGQVFFTAGGGAGGLAAVPEPGALGIVAMMGGLLRRRRAFVR